MLIHTIHYEYMYIFRKLFEQKLPTNFVFVAIYQLQKRNSVWRLFDIKDSSGNTHLALEFSGKKKERTVSLIYKNQDRAERKLVFNRKVGKMVGGFS